MPHIGDIGRVYHTSKLDWGKDYRITKIIPEKTVADAIAGDHVTPASYAIESVARTPNGGHDPATADLTHPSECAVIPQAWWLPGASTKSSWSPSAPAAFAGPAGFVGR